MFEALATYNKIIVTGPHRSGTTICAKMIAHDTGHEFIDEVDYAMHNAKKFLDILDRADEHNHMVVQAPSFSRSCNHLTDDDTMIIFMLRNRNDVLESQRRIGWNPAEYMKSYGVNTPIELIDKTYNYWFTWQKPFIKHTLEILYDILSRHPLWIPAKQRVEFQPKQTEIII